jgi:hypothetical protein
MYTFLASPIRAIYPLSHPSWFDHLDYVNEEYKLRCSSLCNVCQAPVPLSLLRLDNLLNTHQYDALDGHYTSLWPDLLETNCNMPFSWLEQNALLIDSHAALQSAPSPPETSPVRSQCGIVNPRYAVTINPMEAHCRNHWKAGHPSPAPPSVVSLPAVTKAGLCSFCCGLLYLPLEKLHSSWSNELERNCINYVKSNWAKWLLVQSAALPVHKDDFRPTNWSPM